MNYFRRFRWIGWLLLSIIAVPITFAQTPSAQLNGQKLADDIWRQAAREGVPALGLVIFDEARPILTQTFGRSAAGPVTPQTPFRWGSITKTFTALTVLSLLEEYNIDPASPVREFLPAEFQSLAFANPYPPSRLQIHHLLELTTGLADLAPVEWNSAQPLTMAQALQLAPQNRRLLWPAGLQHSYSNTPPGLSALLVTKVSGESFGQQLHKRVLHPLGMQGAGIEPQAALPGGFKADGQTPIAYWHMTYPAFGALNASVVDMQKFVGALLNDGVVSGRLVLSEFQQRHLKRPSTGLAAQAGLTLGYAAGIYGRVRNGMAWWGHGGDADGYRSRYAVHYPSGRGYILVINTDNPGLLKRLEAQLEKALSVGVALTKPAKAQLSNEQLQRYVGQYYPSSTRFDQARWAAGDLPWITISTTADSNLRYRRQTFSRDLLPVNEALFRRRSDPEATVAFKQDRQGFMHMQGELGNFVRLTGKDCPSFFPRCPRLSNR